MAYCRVYDADVLKMRVIHGAVATLRRSVIKQPMSVIGLVDVRPGAGGRNVPDKTSPYCVASRAIAVMLHGGRDKENEPDTVPRDWEAGVVQTLLCESSYCVLPYNQLVAENFRLSFVIATAVVAGRF